MQVVCNWQLGYTYIQYSFGFPSASSSLDERARLYDFEIHPSRMKCLVRVESKARIYRRRNPIRMGDIGVKRSSADEANNGHHRWLVRSRDRKSSSSLCCSHPRSPHFRPCCRCYHYFLDLVQQAVESLLRSGSAKVRRLKHRLWLKRQE